MGLQNNKILVIDDDTCILQVIELFLDSKGFDVRTASDGISGISIAKEFQPDLIILDVKMPKMSGYMVLRLLSDDPLTQSIPVLLLTATAGINDDQSMETPSVSKKMAKPFDQVQLLDAIDHVFKHPSPYKNG